MKSISRCPICQRSPVATFSSKIPLKKGTKDIYQSQVENFAVKLCGQKEPSEVLSVCWSCKSVYRAAFFDSDELLQIYQSEYIGMEDEISDEVVYHDPAFLKESSIRTFHMVKEIERTYGTEIRDIFDIGGRDGFRMSALAENGYKCKVFDPIPCEPCNPLIAKEFVLGSGIADGERADLIILGSMLEHCEDPHEIIESCRRHLREGGFLYLDLPYDIATFFEWLVWRRWVGKTLGIDYTHNIFYTRRAVQYLLGEHQLAVLTNKFTTVPANDGIVLMATLSRKVDAQDDLLKCKKWRSLDFDLLILRYLFSILSRAGRRFASLWRGSHPVKN